MRTPRTFLRSKVARRIVLLFFSCALLPVTILAAISYYQVSSQLRNQSEKQLTNATKDQGMVIYERLEMLDTDLQLLSAQPNQQAFSNVARALSTHLEGVAVFAADGSQRVGWGTTLHLPQLSSAEMKHLQADKALLKVPDACDAGGGCVYMLRLTNASAQPGILIAKSTADLWAQKNLPEGLSFCVLSASRFVLFCPDNTMRSTPNALPLFPHASGLYQWQSDGVAYDTAYWKLMTKPMFLEDSWTIAVTQKHSDAFGVMMRFRASFPLLILLSLWIVLLFSLIQIRRTLGPLEELKKGTREIAAGKFEGRVEVSSGDEFQALALSFNSMATTLGKQFHTLRAINEIDQAMFASLDREAIVDAVLTHIPNLFSADCFGVSVIDDSQSALWTSIRHTDTGQVNTCGAPLAGTGWEGLKNSASGLLLQRNEDLPAYLAPYLRFAMSSFLVFPVRDDKAVQAVLVCANRTPETLRMEHVQEVRQVAEQLAVAFSHVRLIKALEQLHWGTLTALARAIDAKSTWTAGHSERVTHVAVAIGRKLGLSTNDLRIMHIGGLLHDIGKIGTPPTILDKPGALTAEEMGVMREHVRTGLSILEPIPGLQEALPIVAQHHEWFNGAGYPEGIAGEEISLFARIFAVADCYDALTSDRPYRKGLPIDKVASMLQERSGTQFDPKVINAFMSVIATEDPIVRSSAVPEYEGVM